MRVNAAVAYLTQLAGWFGADGLVDLKEAQSLSKQVLDIFSAVRTRIPKRVFLARWYPLARHDDEFEAAKLRLKQIRQGSQRSGAGERHPSRTGRHGEPEKRNVSNSPENVRSDFVCRYHTR